MGSLVESSGNTWGTSLNERERYELERMNAAMNSAVLQQQIYANQAGIGLGTVSQSSYQEAQSSFQPEFGVLYDGKTPLPDDWAGAKITSVEREANSLGWCIRFKSKWDGRLQITLWLDIEQVNGTEAHTIASTYMEALNQRRVG